MRPQWSLNALRAACLELWRDGRGWILVVVSAGWLLSLGTRLVYPAILPYIRADFDLGLASVGLLVTVLWAAYAIGQFPGGVLGDLVGERTVLVASTVVAAVALLAVSVAPSVWLLFLATGLFGLTTALYGPTRFTVFADIYANRMGTAIGLSMAAGSVGNAVLPVIAVSLAAAGSWRTSFAAFVPLFLVISVGLWIVLPHRTAPERGTTASGRLGLPAGLREGLTGGAIPLFVAIQCTMGLVYQGFIGFYPTYLIVVKGLSEGVAAALFGLFFAMSVVVQPMAGVALDRLGLRRSLVAVLGTITVSLLALPAVAGLAQLAALTVFLSCISGYGAITQTTIADAIPTAMKGTGLGMLRSGWILFGSVSPVAIGILGDRGLFTEGFLALGGIAAVGLCLALFAPATR